MCADVLTYRYRRSLTKAHSCLSQEYGKRVGELEQGAQALQETQDALRQARLDCQDVRTYDQVFYYLDSWILYSCLID